MKVEEFIPTTAVTIMYFHIDAGFVYRLGHMPFTYVRRVRFPYPVPNSATSVAANLNIGLSVLLGSTLVGLVGRYVKATTELRNRKEFMAR